MRSMPLFLYPFLETVITVQLSDDYRVRLLDHLQWVLERRSEARAGQLKRTAGRESGWKQLYPA